MLMDDKKYWVGFNLIKGIGAVRMQGLVAYFGDLESAWKAPLADLAGAGLGLKVIERVVQARQSVDLDKVWERIEKQGINILTWQTNRRQCCTSVVTIHLTTCSRWRSWVRAG
jgi:DNA processing protein